ncbi:MAG: hypothetical protein, partial [Olavius algarvensis Delta 4 endosymbiont]
CRFSSRQAQPLALSSKYLSIPPVATHILKNGSSGKSSNAGKPHGRL